MMFTVYTCIILISWFGAKMIVVDSLTTGELMSLLAYCMNILMSLMMLSMVFVMISMSMASMRRIAEVLNEKQIFTIQSIRYMKSQTEALHLKCRLFL